MALAGVWPLPPAKMPVGVDLKAPNVDLVILLIALWYSPSTPICPFHVSSAAYIIVPSFVARVCV